MKKGYLITTIVIATLILSSIIYFFQARRHLLGYPSSTYITETGLIGKYSIEFFYVKSSLSSNCIQVRKKIHKINSGNYNGIISYETREEYILENYEHYDNLIGYCLFGDTLTIFLKKGYNYCEDSFGLAKCDTFQLNINDVEYKIK